MSSPVVPSGIDASTYQAVSGVNAEQANASSFRQEAYECPKFPINPIGSLFPTKTTYHRIYGDIIDNYTIAELEFSLENAKLPPDEQARCRQTIKELIFDSQVVGARARLIFACLVLVIIMLVGLKYGASILVKALSLICILVIGASLWTMYISGPGTAQNAYDKYNKAVAAKRQMGLLPFKILQDFEAEHNENIKFQRESNMRSSNSNDTGMGFGLGFIASELLNRKKRN